MNKWRFPFTYYVNMPTGLRFVEIKGKWSWTRLKASIHFTNPSGERLRLKVRPASLMSDRFELLHGEKVIAYAIRGQSPGSMPKQEGCMPSFEVHVEAGVDAVLVGNDVVGSDEVC